MSCALKSWSPTRCAADADREVCPADDASATAAWASAGEVPLAGLDLAEEALSVLRPRPQQWWRRGRPARALAPVSAGDLRCALSSSEGPRGMARGTRASLNPNRRRKRLRASRRELRLPKLQPSTREAVVLVACAVQPAAAGQTFAPVCGARVRHTALAEIHMSRVIHS